MNLQSLIRYEQDWQDRINAMPHTTPAEVEAKLAKLEAFSTYWANRPKFINLSIAELATVTGGKS